MGLTVMWADKGTFKGTAIILMRTLWVKKGRFVLKMHLYFSFSLVYAFHLFYCNKEVFLTDPGPVGQDTTMKSQPK